MSQLIPLVNIALSVFQASAQAVAEGFLVAEVTTHTHCAADELPRYYCRYRLTDSDKVYEAPADTTPAKAVRALRDALCTHLKKSPSSN